MKKIFLIAVASGMLAISAMAAQVIVQVAPPRVVVENRGRAPQRGYVYQRGYHRWDGNAYAWQPGVWASPPSGRTRWVDHRWDHRREGYVYTEGHWR
jgi:hypothetical protein